MKPNNNPPKEGRSATRAISPSFRTGPRQRPSDASTDEIVRFVREYQRSKPSPQVHTISAMKTKAVLPSIERKRSDLSKSQDKRLSMSIEEDSVGHSYEWTNEMDNDSKYAAYRMTEAMENRLEQNVDIDHNRFDASPGAKSNGFQMFGADRFDKSRNYKSNDLYNEPIQKRRANYDISFDGDRRMSRTNGLTDERNSYARHKRGSVNTQTSYIAKDDSTSSSTDQSFLQNNIARPSALRQLPPITNKEMQSSSIRRPCAPSPNKASPALDSASEGSCADDNIDDNDDDEDDGYDEVEDEEEEEERGGGSGYSGAIAMYSDTRHKIDGRNTNQDVDEDDGIIDNDENDEDYSEGASGKGDRDGD